MVSAAYISKKKTQNKNYIQTDNEIKVMDFISFNISWSVYESSKVKDKVGIK